MVSIALETFTKDILSRGAIRGEDVRLLQRDILPDGVECRDEADVLIALDRAVQEKDPAWSSFLIQAVVDYVVWTTRPTGRVDRETAEWLIASLGCGTGPTENAHAIAFEIVRESESSDETLVAFVMRWSCGRLRSFSAGEPVAFLF